KQIVQTPGNKDCAGIATSYVLATHAPGEYAHKIVTLAEQGSLSEGRGGQAGNTMAIKNPILPPGQAGESLTQQILGQAFSLEASGSTGNTHDGVTGKGMADTLNGGYYGPDAQTYDRMYVPGEKQEPDPAKRAEAKDAAAQVMRE